MWTENHFDGFACRFWKKILFFCITLNWNIHIFLADGIDKLQIKCAHILQDHEIDFKKKQFSLQFGKLRVSETSVRI